MKTFDGRKSPERRAAVESQGLVADTLVADYGRDDDLVTIPLHFNSYKKRVLTYAVRIDEPFEVHTIEGLHTGKAGDFLAVGPAGEMYPIDAAVFAESYELT